MADVNVKGLAELQKYLDAFPPKMERNVLRGALRAGANVVKKAAFQNIHHVSGDLGKSLKVRSNARGGKVTASVYTRVFYAKFVEHGTRPHTITAKNRKGLSFGGMLFQSVDHPGIVNPKPFLRPALYSQAAPAVVAVGEYIKNRLATKHGLDTADIEIAEEA